jgi:hypothetical protein
MNNIFLPIALWAAIGLAGLSILVMALSGLRSIWYGKVQPLTIGLIALPGVLVLVLGGVMDTWVQAGIYTLVVLFALLLLGMVATGLRQMVQSAFS